jgi:hypothetical protein
MHASCSFGVLPAKHSVMDSLKLFFSLIVLTFLLSLHAPCSSFEDHGINVLESQKVNLSLYYETLCPSCATFIVNELANKVFEEDFLSIINLRLVPYGNAQVQQPNNTIVCQVTFPIFTIFLVLLLCLHNCIIAFASYSAAWPRRMLL